MSSHKLATRYAKSLIQLAQEKGKLNDVYKDMTQIDHVFESNRDLKLMFKSPIITADKKLGVVKALFEGKISDLLYSFLTLMIKKGREAFFHEMAQAFILQYNSINKITPVVIKSAVKLDAGLVQSMVEKLKKNENLQTIQLTEVIDESLIGGFVLTYGDKMIDSSVSSRVAKLKNIIEDDTYIKKYS